MTKQQREAVAKEMATVCVKVLLPQLSGHSEYITKDVAERLMSEWRETYGKLWESERVYQ